MPINVKVPDRTDYIPCPTGLHHAVCVDVVDMGIVDGGQYGPKHKVRIVWQTGSRDASGQRYLVTKRYTASLHKKAALRQDLVSWRGLDFEPEQLKGFDLEKLLGANCQLNVVHNTTTIDGDQVTFANVATIVPPPQGVDRLNGENYTREVEREQQQQQAPQAAPQSDGPAYEEAPAEGEVPDFEMEF